VGLGEVGGCGVIGDERVTFEFKIVRRLRQQNRLELLLVNLAVLHAYFDEELDGGSHLSLVNDVAVTLASDLFDEAVNEAGFDHRIEDNFFFEA